MEDFEYTISIDDIKNKYCFGLGVSVEKYTEYESNEWYDIYIDYCPFYGRKLNAE